MQTGNGIKRQNQWEVHIIIMIYDGTAGTLLNRTHNSLADIYTHTQTHTFKGNLAAHITPTSFYSQKFVPDKRHACACPYTDVLTLYMCSHVWLKTWRSV